MIRIAIDCMGGDHGLPVTVPAAVAFCERQPGVRLLLVGRPDGIEAQLASAPADVRGRVSIVPASEVVEMDDPVEVALRRKKDSSMRVAATLVKEGQADACLSAGNTGAWMAITRYVLKMLDGIDRPALTASIPNGHGGATTVLDLGANVDCTAEHLLQFAIMGSALVSAVEQVERPRVGLLNVGEEVIKGNDVVKEAAEMLRASTLNFHGNVEGNEIFQDTVDVVVCDGFVGNVVLKATEGLARMISTMIRQEFRRTPLTMAAGVLATPVLNRFREQVDSRRYNGAALLGLRGVVVKSHGSADAYAFGWALQRAYDAVAGGLQERTALAVAQLTKRAEETRQ
ncbi:phosphate acyltransferase PlsX [Verticiella sediminum]|uniref:Phosphate acyltransferase n=1 Tax=Verticiella sediminum TaxID=1247510 RepID=A0A556AS37_9BURK|nr:phosphate acyltransferase PlsX [Verticiella sediminum]TSH95748.1 phosphate acyltransferase PlsX [Verticiella sediminum]